MSETAVPKTLPKMQKWPFFIGDLLALVACYVIYNMGGETFETGKAFACVVCVVFGAIFAAYPFIQEYRLNARFAEADQLAQVTDFMGRLEKVKSGVTIATAHLETAQDFSEKTVESSREIAERMTEEAKAFADFMVKANDTEKAHLQLEVDKLKQAEGEWLKTLVTILDETHRIFRAAAQSGNPRVAEQLGKFQMACRGTANRVGLVAYEAEFGEPFNAERHVLPDPNAKAPEDARVGATIAPGYTFQRQPVRPALVELQGAAAPSAGSDAPEPEQPEQVETAPDPDPAPADDPTPEVSESESPMPAESAPTPDESIESNESDESPVEPAPDQPAIAAGEPADESAEAAEIDEQAESFSEEADFVATELAELEQAGEDDSSSDDDSDSPESGQRELL